MVSTLIVFLALGIAKEPTMITLQEKNLPPIDLAAPSKVETATFALG